jgi:hypothetical protein
MVEPERPQMAMWRRIACWIISLHARTHAHTDTEMCNTYWFCTQQWFHERASLLRYTYIVADCLLCLFYLILSQACRINLWLSSFIMLSLFCTYIS